MRDRAIILLLLAASLGGCVDTPRVSLERENANMDAALVQVAMQVRRCYRAPRVSSLGRQIITRLRIRLTPDGQVATLPVVVAQNGITPGNETYAGRMAEAAIEAVMRCAPMRLPETAFRNGWSEFELTFSPLSVG